jgi:hypothetical protein
MHPFILDKRGDLNFGHDDPEEPDIEHSDVRQLKMNEVTAYGTAVVVKES